MKEAWTIQKVPPHTHSNFLSFHSNSIKYLKLRKVCFSVTVYITQSCKKRNNLIRNKTPAYGVVKAQTISKT